MLSHNALVVVADGHQATLYRNTAKSGIELVEKERLTPQNLLDESSGRHSEANTPRDEDEATFAKQVAEVLNQLVLQHKVEELVVIADPTTLGSMRKHYRKALEQVLVKELSKTLTSAPLTEIEKALA